MALPWIWVKPSAIWITRALHDLAHGHPLLLFSLSLNLVRLPGFLAAPRRHSVLCFSTGCPWIPARLLAGYPSSGLSSDVTFSLRHCLATLQNTVSYLPTLPLPLQLKKKSLGLITIKHSTYFCLFSFSWLLWLSWLSIISIYFLSHPLFSAPHENKNFCAFC